MNDFEDVGMLNEAEDAAQPLFTEAVPEEDAPSQETSYVLSDEEDRAHTGHAGRRGRRRRKRR